VTPLQPITNGSSEYNAYAPISATEGVIEDNGVEKRNSLGRSGHVARVAQARRPPGAGLGKQGLGIMGKTETPDGRPHGVSLTDKPMDD